MRIGLIDNLGSNYLSIKENISTASAEDILNACGGNTGNIAYVYGAKKILGDPIFRVNWGDNYSNIKENCDVLVICCANQIGGHTNLQLWSEMLEALKLPVVLLGLGAQSGSYGEVPEITEGTMNFLKAVASLKPNPDYPNIACRGSYTAEYLYSIGIPAVPLTCPSLFISPDKNLGELISEYQKKSLTKSLCILAGNPFDPKIANIESRLSSLVDEFNGIYVLQHPIGLIRLGAGEGKKMTDEQIAFHKKVYKKTEKVLLNWFEMNSYISIDPEAWMFELRKFSGLFGPRYHGVALGVQVGRPGTLITIDSRTAELAKSSHIKTVSIQEFNDVENKDIPKLINWSKQQCEDFELNRKDLADLYRIFLTKNILTPSNHLLNLI